jgi:hypothetical protein
VLNRKEFIYPGIKRSSTSGSRQDWNGSGRTALNCILTSSEITVLGHKLVGIADDIGSRINGYANLSTIEKGSQNSFGSIPIIVRSRCTQERLIIYGISSAKHINVLKSVGTGSGTNRTSRRLSLKISQC